jgi:hypothetical protein
MYAIRFDFPEGSVLYAGLHKGAMGWAPTLDTAIKLDTEEAAQNHLEHGYGASAIYGTVIAIEETT